jgi:hypothetical protein
LRVSTGLLRPRAVASHEYCARLPLGMEDLAGGPRVDDSLAERDLLRRIGNRGEIQVGPRLAVACQKSAELKRQ